MNEEYRLIPLTQGQFAKVSPEDYDWLMRWKWQAAWKADIKSFYACRTDRSTGKQVKISMHREVVGVSPDRSKLVDHINRDTLDNRLSNLRVATNSQNQHNQKRLSSSTSGLKGATWHKRMRRWRAQIMRNKVIIHIGYFNTKEEAHAAYMEKATELFGEFARAE